MSRNPETTFIHSVHEHLSHDQPYRMKNNNEYIGGIADVWYSGKRSDKWIEYKFLPRIPKSNQIALKITDLQREWLRDRYNEGRNVNVILGTKEGGIIFHALEWENIFTQEELTRRILSRKEIAKWIAKNTVGVYIPPPKGKRMEVCR